MNVKYRIFAYDESTPGEGWFGKATLKYPHMNDLLKVVAEFASTIEPHKLINICTNTDQQYDTMRNRIVTTVWYWE